MTKNNAFSDALVSIKQHNTMVFDEGALKSVNTADLPDRKLICLFFIGENVLRMLQK
jgi:hypothetical protein